MDVTCQKCGVEYEFEDDRITPEGVTVKCTACGHIFKVKREVRVVTEPVMPAQKIGSDWMVRQASGNVFNFKELTTLQRWIVERKVSRDDEISRTGKNWKRLGDIAELASFFQVVDDAAGRNLAEMQAMMAAQNQMQGLSMANLAAFMTSPGIPVPAQFAEPSADQPVPLSLTQPLPAGQPGAQVTNPNQTLQHKPATTLPPSVVAPNQDPNTAAVGIEEAWQAGAASDFLDDEDPVREWQRRRRWPLFLLLLVLLLGGGIAGLRFADKPLFDRLATQLGFSQQAPVVVRKAQEDTVRALAEDSPEALQQASELCGQAIAALPNDPELLALTSVLRVRLAENSQEAYQVAKAAYEAESKKFPQGVTAGSPEALALKKRAQQAEALAAASQSEFKAAAETVQAAVKLSPDHDDVLAAAADYARAVDKLSEAKRYIERVKDASAWRKLVQLQVTWGGSQALPKRIEALRKLVQEQPANARARYLLARGQALSNKPERAKQSFQAVLALVPSHAGAKAWLSTLQQTPTAAVVDAGAGPTDSQPTGPVETAKAPVPTKDPATKNPAPQGSGTKAPDDKETISFEALIKKAERWRERDNSKVAFKLYSKAAEMEPQRPEPRAGMGWCYLDEGKTLAAISSFQSTLDVAPNYADAHMGLAEGYRARGKKLLARKHYQRYLDISPAGPDASVARRWVEELADVTE